MGLIAMLGVNCAPADSPSLESQTNAIVGGTATRGDPAVVQLAIDRAGTFEGYCTGTLIAPQTVLTAAHCINRYGEQAPYVVLFGFDVQAPQRSVAVASQVGHPSYDHETNDFGLLRLTNPVLDVAPLALNPTPLGAATVGSSIRHVGFGVTNGATRVGGGLKREVTYAVQRVEAALLWSGGDGTNTCDGDSGGPGLMVLNGQEKLAGVVSFGDRDCVTNGADGRVDVALQWILRTMAAWESPTCALDGSCRAGCTPMDQDCAPNCDADGICSSGPCPRDDTDCITSCNEAVDCPTDFECFERACRHLEKPEPDNPPAKSSCSTTSSEVLVIGILALIRSLRASPSSPLER